MSATTDLQSAVTNLSKEVAALQSRPGGAPNSVSATDVAAATAAINAASAVIATINIASVKTGLTVVPASIALTVGQTATLVVTDASGANVTASSSFSSGNTAVASVSSAGVVTAIAIGSTAISVAQGSNAGVSVSTVVS